MTMSSATALTAPMRQLLSWIQERPRTYDEVMDAWRSSCPRLTVWEDALEAGYVRATRSTETGEVVIVVTVTARGLAALGGEWSP